MGQIMIRFSVRHHLSDERSRMSDQSPIPLEKSWNRDVHEGGLHNPELKRRGLMVVIVFIVLYDERFFLIKHLVQGSNHRFLSKMVISLSQKNKQDDIRLCLLMVGY